MTPQLIFWLGSFQVNKEVSIFMTSWVGSSEREWSYLWLSSETGITIELWGFYSPVRSHHQWGQPVIAGFVRNAEFQALFSYANQNLRVGSAIPILTVAQTDSDAGTVRRTPGIWGKQRRELSQEERSLIVSSC